MSIINKFRKIFIKRKFDRIVSLGFNCEVAFQFLKFYDFVEANLFTWTFVYETKDLLNALLHLDAFAVDFEPANAYMWKSKSFDISFHGRSELIPTDEEIRNAEKEELISRAAHLKNKFKALSEERGKILFVYKVPLSDLEHVQDTVDTLGQIVESLRTLGIAQFKVLVIVTTGYYTKYKAAVQKSNESDSLFIEHIEFHAPISTVTTGPYDLNGWRSIWAKYVPSKRLKRGRYKFDM